MAPRVGFVLSGFGSLAAVQVGMLAALADAGIVPDVVVGTSFGAVNAAWAAAGPGAEGVEALRRVWGELADHDVPPFNPVASTKAFLGDLPFRPARGARRALGLRNHVLPVSPWTVAGSGAGLRDHLVSNRNLAKFLRRRLPIERLGDAALPLRLVATDAVTGEPVALSHGEAVPAVLASMAVPGIFPGVTIDGRELTDGWVARHTAIEEAAAMGAEEVYVLPTGYTCDLPRPPFTLAASALRMFDLAVEQRLVSAVEQAPSGVRVRVVPPLCPAPVLPFDFRCGHVLVARARRATERWLEDGQPTAGLSRPLGEHEHRRPA